jgi:hypothetical protein
MSYVVGPFGLVDCSPEAQAKRLRDLDELKSKIRSGVSNVGDRGRSVTYQSPAEMWKIAAQMEKELLACELGYWWPGRKRLAYIDQVKGL